MPSIEELHDVMRRAGLKVVAVSVDDPGTEHAIRDFVNEYGLTFEILHDPEQDRPDYQTTGFPETFVIGREGAIRKKVIGADDWDSAANRALFASCSACPSGARRRRRCAGRICRFRLALVRPARRRPPRVPERCRAPTESARRPLRRCNGGSRPRSRSASGSRRWRCSRRGAVARRERGRADRGGGAGTARGVIRQLARAHEHTSGASCARRRQSARLVKLYADPPVVRRAVTDDAPDTVVLDLNPADVVHPADVDAVVRDIQPRTLLLGSSDVDPACSGGEQGRVEVVRPRRQHGAATRLVRPDACTITGPRQVRRCSAVRRHSTSDRRCTTPADFAVASRRRSDATARRTVQPAQVGPSRRVDAVARATDVPAPSVAAVTDVRRSRNRDVVRRDVGGGARRHGRRRRLRSLVILSQDVHRCSAASCPRSRRART